MGIVQELKSSNAVKFSLTHYIGKMCKHYVLEVPVAENDSASSTPVTILISKSYVVSLTVAAHISPMPSYSLNVYVDCVNCMSTPEEVMTFILHQLCMYLKMDDRCNCIRAYSTFQ